MNKKWFLGSLAIAALGAAWACGGSTTSATGGADAGPDGTGSSSGSTGSGSGTTGSDDGGSGSGSSGGGSSSSSGGNVGDGGQVVEGGAFPCGQAVCNPPNVCCTSFGGGGGGGMTTCEPHSMCTMGIAETCTADTCPSGALCCATFMASGGSVSGSTACVVGTSCPGTETQLCSTMVPCPSGDRCQNGICRKMMTPPDGGGFPKPDSGTTIDAGGD